MKLYVGIDPGVRACGVAVIQRDNWSSATWGYGPELSGALWARTETAEALSDDIAEATIKGVRKVMPHKSTRTYDVHVAIEMPETQNGRARGDAATSDLLELSYVVGRIYQACMAQQWKVLRTTPRSWKRGVPTDALTARLELPPPLGLTKDEQSRVVWPAPSYRHNVVDAIWLARWLAAKF